MMVLQVHDSIVLDCPADEVEWVSAEVAKIMVNVDLKRYTGNRLQYDIPLAVDVKIGDHL